MNDNALREDVAQESGSVLNNDEPTIDPTELEEYK